VAYLHGKSIRERAKALIEIADPKFREQLYEYCEQTKWLQRPEGWDISVKQSSIASGA
jgi:acyl-CoA hydrolase